MSHKSCHEMQSCLDNSGHQNLNKSPTDLNMRRLDDTWRHGWGRGGRKPGGSRAWSWWWWRVLTAAESRSLWRWPRCLVAEKWTPSADGGPITGRLSLCRPIRGGLASLCQPIATQYSVWSCPLLFFGWLLVLFTPGFTHQNLMRSEVIFTWNTSTYSTIFLYYTT